MTVKVDTPSEILAKVLQNIAPRNSVIDGPATLDDLKSQFTKKSGIISEMQDAMIPAEYFSEATLYSDSQNEYFSAIIKKLEMFKDDTAIASAKYVVDSVRIVSGAILKKAVSMFIPDQHLNSEDRVYLDSCLEDSCRALISEVVLMLDSENPVKVSKKYPGFSDILEIVSGLNDSRTAESSKKRITVLSDNLALTIAKDMDEHYTHMAADVSGDGTKFNDETTPLEIILKNNSAKYLKSGKNPFTMAHQYCLQHEAATDGTPETGVHRVAIKPMVLDAATRLHQMMFFGI